MTQRHANSEKATATKETFIISRTEEGFRVYSPLHPTESFIVSGSAENPLCTCLDFQEHIGDLTWHCGHIEAVLDQLARQSQKEEAQAPAPQPGPKGSGNGTEKPRRKRANGNPNGHAQMLLKRSVSPDGRIDSLSVEFSCPVEKASEEEIKAKAAGCLKLQAEIMAEFLKGNGKREESKESQGKTPAALSAQIVSVGGMNGQWGRRLFLTIQANGRTLRLYGGKKRLVECIASAGHRITIEQITEGLLLNLPCRIETVPSPDGQYLNVERVLPATAPMATGRV